MSSILKLKQALNLIDEAKNKLKKAANDIEDDSQIKKVLRVLEDAEHDIGLALRELGK